MTDDVEFEDPISERSHRPGNGLAHMTRIEQTLDGKQLPRHLRMFHDERGDPGLEDARIDVWGKDFTSSKGKVNELLGK